MIQSRGGGILRSSDPTQALVPTPEPMTIDPIMSEVIKDRDPRTADRINQTTITSNRDHLKGQKDTGYKI